MKTKLFENINENTFKLKNVVNEGVESGKDVLNDPNYIANIIKQIYGNQPSIQELVEYFATEYGTQPTQPTPQLIKIIIEKFQQNNPKFYTILNRNPH